MKRIHLLSVLLVALVSGAWVIKETKSNEDLKFYVSPSGTPAVGMTLNGTTNVLALTNPLPLASGGTNATSASTARTSLGLGPLAVLTAPTFSSVVTISGVANVASTATCAASLSTLYTINSSTAELASLGDCVLYKVVANSGSQAATALINVCRAGSNIFSGTINAYAQASGSGAIALSGNGTSSLIIQYTAVSACGGSTVELVQKWIN